MVIWGSLAGGQVGGVKKEAGSLSPYLPAQGLYPDLPAGCRPLAQAPWWPLCRGTILSQLLLSLGRGQLSCPHPVLGMRFIPADPAAPRDPHRFSPCPEKGRAAPSPSRLPARPREWDSVVPLFSHLPPPKSNCCKRSPSLSFLAQAPSFFLCPSCDLGVQLLCSRYCQNQLPQTSR